MPIAASAAPLCFFAVPLPTDALSGFLFASLLLIAGMGFFNLGTEMAMTAIGKPASPARTWPRPAGREILLHEYAQPRSPERRTSLMNRGICLRLAALLCCLVLLCGTAGADSYRKLKEGNAGKAVLDLKLRMYELGYFASDKQNREFNAVTREQLIELQRVNGLEPDGIATPEVQAFIFSDACLPKPALPDPYAAAPEQVLPPPAGEDPPTLDEDGYLAEPGGPYVYASREEGAWTYVSRDIRVEVRQFVDEVIPHIWLEAAIRVRDPSLLTDFVNMKERGGKYTTFLSSPITIAEKNGAILAFSDDYFGGRIYRKATVGIVIREGIVWGKKTLRAAAKGFPPLDVMARFADGTLKGFESDAHTPEEYAEMGAVSTYAFGPLLIRDGKITDDLLNWNAGDTNPRVALGQAADGTIRVLCALGRRKDAHGVTFRWVAERMLEMGAVEAINLDGGATAMMIFMGDVINHPVGTTSKELRTMTSMIGVREKPAEE